MNCDEVFTILTRGPFPTGEIWDEEVEAHLETCTDCWRLAEALRPALEVFQEAVPPAESRDLPGYWGDARPAGAVVAELTSTHRSTVVARTQRTTAPHKRYQSAPLINTLAVEVLRITALVSILMAAVICFVLVWSG